MKKIEKIVLILFFLSLTFVPFLWLSKGQLILGYDAVFPLNPTAFLLDRVYSWTSTQGFSMDQSGIQGSLVIHFIDSVPYFLGFSAEYAQKIVFSFWFFAILFSSFLFILRIEKYNFIKSKYLKYLFPVFYTFNFYLLQGWWAIERTKFSLVVATPLILSVILPMVKEKMTIWKLLKSSILCSFILTVFNGGGWVGLPLYGGLLVILGCYYVFFSFVFLLRRENRKVILLNLFFIFFLLWYLLLNAYTLLPFFLTTIKDYSNVVSSAGGIEGVIGWSRYLSENTSFLNLFRLQGIPDWYNNGSFHPYASIYLNIPFFIFISFLIPLLVFASLFKKINDRRMIIPLLLLILLVSQFFAAGAHPPLGFIFQLFMHFIPGFIAFRSAIFKFGYAYWFCISFFLSFALSNFVIYISRKIKNISARTFLEIVVLIFIIFIVLAYHFPFFTGNIFKIESTSISSRVNEPYYVSEFARWWQINGKTDKILLLPKLNDNWLFEQYRWNYMSLFPVTGNFGSKGIIENAAILTGEETNTVNALYEAINDSNYEKTDFLLSILGIRYFLLRHDFYYDLPNQETDNPIAVEEKLIKNPKIHYLIKFGQWSVYKYADPKPLLIVQDDPAIVSENVNIDELYALEENNKLIFGDIPPEQYYKTTPSILLNSLCLNCSIERDERSIAFIKPKILMNSKLYQFIEWRDKLILSKNEAYETKLNRLIGTTLKLADQIDELINQNRNEYYINLATNKYLELLKEIADEMPNIFKKLSNPYYHTLLIHTYLGEEEKFFNQIIKTDVGKEETLIKLQKILNGIQILNDKLREYYDFENYNQKKIYKLNIVKPEEYEIILSKSSLGEFDTFDLQSLSLSIDGKASRSAKLNGSNFEFGNIFLSQGDHTLNLYVPDQKSILTNAQYERVANKDCYSSFVNDFFYNKIYNLEFKSKNNFDPDFLFFIDHGVQYSPLTISYIPLIGEQIKNNRIVISSNRMHLDKSLNKLRISFCASGLTEDLYRESIRDLSLVEITSPNLLFFHKGDHKSIPFVDMNFQEIDQTRFKVSVTKVESPYYLVFSQRYSSGWTASVGEHMMGNKFQNAWYINKKGNYNVDIIYSPQKYFNFGIVISGISLLIAILLLVVKRRNV